MRVMNLSHRESFLHSGQNTSYRLEKMREPFRKLSGSLRLPYRGIWGNENRWSLWREGYLISCGAEDELEVGGGSDAATK